MRLRDINPMRLPPLRAHQRKNPAQWRGRREFGGAEGLFYGSYSTIPVVGGRLVPYFDKTADWSVP